MKKTFVLLLAGWLSAGVPTAFAQANPNPPPTPEQQASQLKGKLSKALSDARRDFESSNDRDSAQLIAKMLDSLDQPGGMSPTTLAANGERIKNQMHELVRNGAFESAARLQRLLLLVFGEPIPGATGPVKPNHKTGGTAGPGGLVLYLSFDKADEGGVIHDESGAGNDGRVFGAKWVSEGKFGGAYQFSVTNFTDRIVIPNSDTLNPDYITISAWIKTTDRGVFYNRIVDKDWRNAYAFDEDHGKFQLESSAGGLLTDRALNDGQWHQVAATYDGKAICCYIDGVGKSRQVRKPGPLKKTGWDLCIGNSVVDYGTWEFLAFDGLIDEVRIYNRALSPDEMKALATATHAGVDVLPAVPDTSAAKPDAATRLKQVKSLFDQGLINKDDYDKKVKEIMDSL